MGFKTPWLLVVIPLVGLLGMWLVRRHKQPTIIFSHVGLFDQVDCGIKTKLAWVPRALFYAALVVLLIALAGPQRLLSEAIIKGDGIDIALALDVSGSMAAEDFTINNQRLNRLDVIKNVVADFIKGRPHDQIGLIAFGARAYTVCPLTLDHDWLIANLSRIKLGIVEDGTAIGSGINSAVLRLTKSKAKSKVVILLTDGMNNAGKIDPMIAAKAAKAYGIKVYTIGAGTKGLAPYPVADFFGKKMYQQVQIDIDENMLTEIATLTGGQYFRATDTDSLRSIYHQIDRLEKSAIDQRGYKQYEPLYGYCLLLVLALLLARTILINTVFLTIP